MKHLLAICSSALIALSACFSGSSSTKVETAEITSDSYQFTIQDVRNLQDFLLTRPTEEDLTGKPYDMNGSNLYSWLGHAPFNKYVRENHGIWGMGWACIIDKYITEYVVSQLEYRMKMWGERVSWYCRRYKVTAI